MPRSHFSLEREKIAWLAREYIFNERLLLWPYDETLRPRRERYRIIFEQANLMNPILDESVRINLQRAVRNVELEGSEYEDIFQILSRVALFVQSFGYDHFVQDVTQDGGQWGPSSGIGSQEMINLVPGKKSSACHRIVMGLARGRSERSKGSLKNVMKSLGENIRRCANMTKIAIVITDVWDEESFKDSMDDVALYKRQGKKFLFSLVNGKRLIPMDFSFA